MSDNTYTFIKGNRVMRRDKPDGTTMYFDVEEWRHLALSPVDEQAFLEALIPAMTFEIQPPVLLRSDMAAPHHLVEMRHNLTFDSQSRTWFWHPVNQWLTYNQLIDIFWRCELPSVMVAADEFLVQMTRRDAR